MYMYFNNTLNICKRSLSHFFIVCIVPRKLIYFSFTVWSSCHLQTIFHTFCCFHPLTLNIKLFYFCTAFFISLHSRLTRITRGLVSFLLDVDLFCIPTILEMLSCLNFIMYAIVLFTFLFSKHLHKFCLPALPEGQISWKQMLWR